MKYYAHTIEGRAEDEWHTLEEHLNGTAELAASFSDNEIYSNLFRIAGYLHDLGKYQPAFQKYLKEGGRRGSVPHAKYGAFFLYSKINEISRSIAGHHAGLQDSQLWKMNMLDLDDDACDKSINQFNNEMGIQFESFLKYEIFLTENSPLEREFLTRYIFSALTDADWLDTEKYCSPEKKELRKPVTFNIDMLSSRPARVRGLKKFLELIIFE